MNRYLAFFIVGLASGWAWGFIDGINKAVGSA